MRLSWNEIRVRAAEFSREWENGGYEKGQTQLFYRDFFKIFGVNARRVASFEKGQKARQQIWLHRPFWEGTLLVEQKSRGRSLKKAKEQVFDYFPASKTTVTTVHTSSDFQRFELCDLEKNDEITSSKDLPKHIDKFGFILVLRSASSKTRIR